jgi:tetratricopeptide (TPR) repeat protein
MIFLFRSYYFKIFFAIVTQCLLFSCGENKKEELISNTSSKSPWLNHSDSAVYVGKQTCRLCHEKIYNSYIETGMGHSIDNAISQNSSADFSHPVIYDKIGNYYYRAFRKKDSIYVLEFRLKGNDTIHKRIERIEYIIGSGQHTNSHLINTNGYVNQAPMTFYTQKGKWDLPPGFENGKNSRFSRLIGLECMSCHNAYPDFVSGSENKFTKIPDGIDCERCHGPGSIHVNQKSNREIIDTANEIDYSIVNPAKLPIERQFDICMRCHLQGNAVLTNGKSWFDFRPGMKLSDYITVFLPRYADSESDFIMASHADRLKQSKCYIESLQKSVAKQNTLRPFKEALTCVSCHNPHVSVRETPTEHFNSVCTKCHTPDKKNGCSENEKILNNSKYNCVSCHMPNSGSSDIPHVSIHDHFIRKKISNEQQKKLRNFLGLKAINNSHPPAITIAKAYLNQFEKFDPQTYYLDSAMKYLGKIDDAEKFHAYVQLLFNQKNFAAINDLLLSTGIDSVLKKICNQTSLDNKEAWTCYRAGEALSAIGNYQLAKTFLEQCVRLAPHHPEFRNKLGVCELQLGNHFAARKIFTSIIIDYPIDAKAYTNSGYLDALENDFLSAEKNYLKALTIDPDNSTTLINYGGLKILTEKFLEGSTFLANALKTDPDNYRAQQMMISLLDKLIKSGRKKEAEAILKNVKKINPTSTFLINLNKQH